MKRFIKKLIPEFILTYRSKKYIDGVILHWKNNNTKGAPPHIIKQLHIKNLQNKFNVHVLVETGTYLGSMVKAQCLNFKYIYTIEVSEEIFASTKNSLKALTNVEFLLGDSGEVLQKLVNQIKEPALFWLDGHYSGGITSKGVLNTPIFKELDSIFETPFRHVILIDDAQDFTGKDDYPSIEDLKQYLISKNNNYIFKIKDNMIFILPTDININDVY